MRGRQLDSIREWLLADCVADERERKRKCHGVVVGECLDVVSVLQCFNRRKQFWGHPGRGRPTDLQQLLDLADECESRRQ